MFYFFKNTYIGIPDIMEKLCFLMFRGDCNTSFVKLDFKGKKDDFYVI
jgi:hypothetical protein